MSSQEQSQYSRRIQHLKALGARDKNLDRERLNECKEHVYESYESASIIRHVASIIQERDTEISSLKSIGFRRLIKQWEFNASNYIWRGYFADIGRGVAAGEQKYLQDKILEEIIPSSQTISRTNPDFSNIIEFIESQSIDDYLCPDTILAPISIYVDFVKAFQSQLEWHSSGTAQLSIGITKLNVFWSHKYAPLDNFIVFNSSAGVWSYQPDQNTDRLITVAIGESLDQPDCVEYWAEVLVKYSIITPQAFFVINLSDDLDESEIRL